MIIEEFVIRHFAIRFLIFIFKRAVAFVLSVLSFLFVCFVGGLVFIFWYTDITVWQFLFGR